MVEYAGKGKGAGKPVRPAPTSDWKAKYGQKHRLLRVAEFPPGIDGPEKIRLYRRRDHYVLQWWDPGVKRTLSDRVDGDLVAAISRARQIDERLMHFRASGHKCRRVGHQELVDSYVANLNRRADAGEIDPRTVKRYASALRNYYLKHALCSNIERQFGNVSSVNRDFQLGFATFLANTSVLPNGHPNSKPRPMRGQSYVLDVVRAMFEWAIDVEGGNLLPEGFLNPFNRRGRQGHVNIDQFGEPDITLEMASDFLALCDLYQLRLFAPMILYGLRASEPCFLFSEDLDEGWLKVPCRPEIGYLTKGRREKRLPLLPCGHLLLGSHPERAGLGLLYLRRRVLEEREKAPLRDLPAKDIITQFQVRCKRKGVRTAGERRSVRNHILKEAGAITYDHVVAEFRKLARRLDWPVEATLKDFRHLFATAMENGGMPEHYRKYLMGQSVGHAPIVTYTHLDEVRQRYEEAAQRSFKSLVATTCRRCNELGITVYP